MKKQAFWDKNKCKIAVGFLAVGAAMGLIFIIWITYLIPRYNSNHIIFCLAKTYKAEFH